MRSQISRLSVLLIASSLLASCALFSGKTEEPVTTVVRSPELGCPDALKSEVPAEERLPDGAGIVAPETESEIEATEKYLFWVQRNQFWGRDLMTRAEQARDYCLTLDRTIQERSASERTVQ